MDEKSVRSLGSSAQREDWILPRDPRVLFGAIFLLIEAIKTTVTVRLRARVSVLPRLHPKSTARVISNDPLILTISLFELKICIIMYTYVSNIYSILVLKEIANKKCIMLSKLWPRNVKHLLQWILNAGMKHLKKPLKIQFKCKELLSNLTAVRLSCMGYCRAKETIFAKRLYRLLLTEQAKVVES